MHIITLRKGGGGLNFLVILVFGTIGLVGTSPLISNHLKKISGLESRILRMSRLRETMSRSLRNVARSVKSTVYIRTLRPKRSTTGHQN